MRKKNIYFESGQILLITLLIMVVGLTVGLAVIGRAVTSTKISTQEEESQRAFYAAEAGLEDALLSNVLPGQYSIGSLGANYTISYVTTGGSTVTMTIKKDQPQSVWLAAHDPSGNLLPPSSADFDIGNPNRLDVCWRGPSGSEIPAMEITIVKQRTTGNNAVEVKRDPVDPVSSRRGTNNFANPNGSNDCGGYPYYEGINFNPTANRRGIAIHLRPLYYDATVTVAVTGDTLPSQGAQIESLGKAGSAQRKLRVTRSWAVPPSVFDDVLFSGTGLTK